MPPTSSEPDDDDFDIDAVIKAEEERLAALRNDTSMSIPGSPVLEPSSSRYRERDDADKMDVDEEALWQGLDALPQALPDHPPKAARPVSAQDNDEEMWDIVNELEQDEQNPKPTALMSKEVPISSVVCTASSTSDGSATRATNDEGWDEMYV